MTEMFYYYVWTEDHFHIHRWKTKVKISKKRQPCEKHRSPIYCRALLPQMLGGRGGCGFDSARETSACQDYEVILKENLLSGSLDSV